jgi:hypothetical protein
MYNTILERALGFISKRCYLFYRGQECSNEVKWAQQVRKCYKAMKKMEIFKHQDPKYSN